jgi:hypothetical protein
MIRRAVSVVAVVLASAALASATPGGRNADDVRTLAEAMRTYHPNLYHDTPKATFDAAVADAAARADAMSPDELLVTLMRIAVLPGVRDGHGGIVPFDPAQSRGLHAYPLRLFEFADGTFVTGDASGHDLLGARVVAIAGLPLADVRTRVSVVVPRDNDAWLSNLVTQYEITAEVLHGLKLTADAGPVTFTFERGGSTFDVTLPPITTADYRAQLGDLGRLNASPHAATYLKRQGTDLWTAKLASGRVWYVAYNETLVATSAVAAKLLKVVAPKTVRGIVIDLRNNGGGDNHTYVPLLDALRKLSKKKKHVVVLISRATFSAAENFAVDVERRAKASFVGEPSGGAPNLYGDPFPVDLPNAGLRAYVARIYWEKSTPNDPRLTITPKVLVPLTSADYFAGRDPQLAAAVARARSG